MSGVTRVPQTRTMRDSELAADDPGELLRNYGRWPLFRESYARFRYGDGFSSARALALQICLSLIPLVIAVVGLSASLESDRVGAVLRRVLVGLSPGNTDRIVGETLAATERQAGDGNHVAVALGLLLAVVQLTTAMSQVERGANRIYGIARDRPTRRKYGRALFMACTAGLLSLLGFLVLVAGGTVARAVEVVYRVDTTWFMALRWPVGALLVLGSLTVLFSRAPRRQQPGWSWLALGAGMSLVLWLGLNALLVLYVRHSEAFGTTYGPLTGVVALLAWANLTSIALFLGIAFAAQLEAVRAGVRTGAAVDPELDRVGEHGDAGDEAAPFSNAAVGRRLA